MLDPTQRPAVVTSIGFGVDAELTAVLAAIESDLNQGAVGVVLEPAMPGDPGAEPIPDAVVSAAAALTRVTVTVGSPEQAERALQAGASGVMVRQLPDARLRRTVADRGGSLWMTGISDPPDLGPEGERLILECPVASVARLARLADSEGSLVGSTQIACSLPSAVPADEGVLESLVTLAVAGGAAVLRCGGRVPHGGNSDARVVRRCADVAVELLRSGVGS